MAVERGAPLTAAGLEQAASGTLFWTLSLFAEPARVARALGLTGQDRVTPDVFRRVQLRHLPSFALANAIEPLFNDIADRETAGGVQEFLLATTAEHCATLDKARLAVRRHDDVLFRLPPKISWTTEGVRYTASPEGLDDPRAMRMRRFWLAHNNGALSYHLSFSHHYGSFTGQGGETCDGYDPATLYFLSTLQKLVAPKEFGLHDSSLEALRDDPDRVIDVCADEPTGVDILDAVGVGRRGMPPSRFWPFVANQFRGDARSLFARIDAELGQAQNRPKRSSLADGFEDNLLESTPFIEVPRLRVPKSRFMFHFRDKRFFNRVAPVDPLTGQSVPHKLMVRDDCYRPYREKIAALVADGAEATLDKPFWNWVCTRGDYADLIAPRGPLPPKLRPAGGGLFSGFDDLAPALRKGAAERTVDDQGKLLAQPEPVHIPAFEQQRRDCLDFLFLAGLNQNIIDFMNQDTSEVLDSIDPIYPTQDQQADERFFVRYANHRAMITYVAESRSLEIGNDYIGTCPYAFLIHALSMHNEFLTRSHEARTLGIVDHVQHLLGDGPAHPGSVGLAPDARIPISASRRLDAAEIAINRAKLSEYDDHDRYRYDNPFRYDTERTVFAKLEDLRGVARRTAALTRAIRSLEDHARDLKRRRDADDAQQEARRTGVIQILLGATGIFGAGQMIYSIGENAKGESQGGKSQTSKAESPVVYDLPGYRAEFTGDEIMSTTQAAMFIALILLGAMCLALAIRGTAGWVASLPEWSGEQIGAVRLLWRRLREGPARLARWPERFIRAMDDAGEDPADSQPHG